MLDPIPEYIRANPPEFQNPLGLYKKFFLFKEIDKLSELFNNEEKVIDFFKDQVNGIRVQFMIEQFPFSSKTVIEWRKSINKVMMWKMRKEMKPIGGRGLHVQLDESFIHQRREIGLRNKNLKLFGMICEESKEVVLVLVKDCKKSTLWPIIKHFVLPGSISINYGASVYQTLNESEDQGFGFNFLNHETVIHKEGQYSRESEFETTKRVTTNLIENVWRWVKESVSGQGTKEDIEIDIYAYLYEKQYLRYDQDVRGVPVQIFHIDVMLKMGLRKPKGDV
ncbi:hypothetical protein BLOT_011181 [Blomia tropicalis]|nr:hypothetical protein BLOT_011181 [Blomia tropicalis]